MSVDLIEYIACITVSEDCISEEYLFIGGIQSFVTTTSFYNPSYVSFTQSAESTTFCVFCNTFV
jgi:hypothetical protein